MSAGKRKGLAITRRDGSTTFMPDLAPGEQERLMQEAGLGKLAGGDAGMNPFDLMAGFRTFEQLAGITHAPAPEEDAFDLPDDAQADDGLEP